MQKIAYALVLSAFASPYTQAENWYDSAKFKNARQDLSSSLLTSPQATAWVDAPDNAKSFVAPFAAVYAFDNGWRQEGKYTMPNNSTFKFYSPPFDTNVNSLQAQSQRLMLNGYKGHPDQPIVVGPWYDRPGRRTH
ncbi:hypothetical protein [Pseudomonas sp. SWRI18]|uniref:hypothetical protein n=1 Tax=Pseudomonas sp. SWRI18 TaxID=2753888 RepID=UPI001EE18F55|nr:hypothetical protein [Pseudomonas sp. SWRI18]